MGAHTEVMDPATILPRRNVKNHSAAYKIWHYTFTCTIAQMHLVSAEFLEQGGSITSGNPAIDRQMANNIVTVQITPAAMAGFLAEGATLALVEMSDAAKIYQMIHDHLSDWQRALQNNPHVIKAPVDELRQLDALATAIYPQARVFFRSDPFHGKLVNVLMGMTRSRGGITRTGSLLPSGPAVKAPLPGPEAHTPMAESIARASEEKEQQRRKSWR